MNRALGSEVCHPSKLFKGYKVFELGLDKIHHFNGADVSNLALRKGTLISGSFLIGAKIDFKSGQGRCLLWCRLCRKLWRMWGLHGLEWSTIFHILRPRLFRCGRVPRRHWNSKIRIALKTCRDYASKALLGLFVEHLACDENWKSFGQKGVYPNNLQV